MLFKNELFENSVAGRVLKIRPKAILKLIEKSYSKPVDMKLQIPSSEIGSLTTLEATMLISFIKIINPSFIFEFGTFLGYSTSIFLKNSDEKCNVYTIDLGEEIGNIDHSKKIDFESVLKNDEINDDYLRIMQSKKGPIFINDYIQTEDNRLKLLQGNSLDLSISEISLESKVNIVFIDGGHTLNIVKKDTENAFKMIKTGVIIWHDYNSQIHGDVTKFVDELAKEKVIYHIDNTMLAFHVL